ncbi:MAG TPA: hypothetical protein VJV78_44515 [Polyangiales bacterium]|nr:hypothetical protein [Polyangiales bacterium]
MPSTSGVSVLDVLRATQEIVGEQVFAQARECLPQSVRDEISEITAVSWVRNTLLIEVMREVARITERDTEELVAEAIRRATTRTFTTVWRTLLRFTTDEALIKRAPVIYARSRNCGKLSARMLSPGVAEVMLTDYPNLTPPELRSLGVGIQCILELAGRRHVQVSCERRPDGGRYVFRWRT